MTRARAKKTKRRTGVYPRGNVLWGRYKNADGKWDSISLGLRVGQEEEAARLLAEIKKKVSAGREIGLDPGDGPPTFQRFFSWWIDRRKARKLRAWTDDNSRIRTHVMDLLGPKRLDEITPLDLEKVFLRMRDRGRAPKTVWNAYSSTRALFRDAVKKGFLRQSPCVLGEEELGPMVDKDPEWRETAIYSREEVQALMFDERLPPDRRLFYAISYLAGRRLGETSGLRVRHLDLDEAPLGAVVFARSYARDRTKTNATIRMPVHPVLAEMLRAWLHRGFERMFGRAPEPDDFVVPRPPECRSRFGSSRDKNYVRKQLLKDLDTLELRSRRTHDLRRSFISHAQQDGAQPHVLIRLTHPSAKKATAFAGYTEFSWSDFCGEVAKLKVDTPRPLQVVAPRPDSFAVGVGAPPTSADTKSPKWRTSRPKFATPVATVKKKALENPGLIEWRRRESNPGPKAF
ncbi:MAG: tyrosine-type recombinase/integrase [Myxococcales bacterium]|nr:tyrosine-type recombinase/integrase [Myxococcales bacterium]